MCLFKIRVGVFAFLTLVGILGAGCGKSIVTHASISTGLQDGEQWAHAELQFRTSGIQLPSVTLPIFDPRSPSKVYGELQLSQFSNLIGEAKVSVNLTQVAALPGENAQLPNGAQVPVVVPDEVKLVSIPVPTTQFVVYLAFRLDVVNPSDSPVLMLGVALPFPQFDPLGGTVGTANLFIPFNIRSVTGTAGIFTGERRGTSGIGLFIDFGALIPPSERNSTVVGFLRVSPPERVKWSMRYFLYDLERRGTILTLD